MSFYYFVVIFSSVFIFIFSFLYFQDSILLLLERVGSDGLCVVLAAPKQMWFAERFAVEHLGGKW